MTQPGEQGPGEGTEVSVPTAEAERADPAPPPLSATALPALIFLFIALFMGLDVVSDLRAGMPLEHLVAEIAVTMLALAGFTAMWNLLQSARRRARALQVMLDGTRADLVRWRSEAQELLLGLGMAIDRQFERWSLSPAEREVGLLLLKGLSLKEVAEARRTSERTVRQQALAVYRKAGLAGRAELAAFFLEDLLLPRGEREGPPVAASADRR